MFSAKLKYILVACYLVSSVSYAADTIDENTYTLNRFVAESLQAYSAIKVASLKASRLAYESDKAMSQLGWVLTGQGGYAKTSSTLGLQADVVDFSAGLEKQFESGHSVSLTGRYVHNDSERVLFSLAPNPQDTGNIDLSYRIPLLEGSDNYKYRFAIHKADIQHKLAELDIKKAKEQLMLQLVDIFYQVATIDSRLLTAKKSLQRAKKLRSYIKNNIELGLLEKGEKLQVDSQVYSLKLQYQKILDLREKQVIAINRFLKRPFQSPFKIKLAVASPDSLVGEQQQIISDFISHNYDMKKLVLEDKLLDTALALSRNREKNKLDFIVSLGVQNISGNTSAGAVDDTDTTGMLRLEYRNALDKRAFSAERLQIQIDRQTNKEQLASLKDDLKYDAYNQLNQIKQSREIVKLAGSRNETEKRKYRDILQRYKAGRSTTNIVIQFDNERIQSELDYETERYELFRRLSILRIKRGHYLF